MAFFFQNGSRHLVHRGGRAAALATAVTFSLSLWPALATADVPPATSATAAPSSVDQGVAVLAQGDIAELAWPLAQSVYGSAKLRPAALDEARARVLAGDKPAPDAKPDVVELAELRAGVRGDDAASRELLSTIGQRTHVHALLVVVAADAAPSARLFDVGSKTFDAARYEPEAGDAGDRWEKTVRSLERVFAPPPPVVAPKAATAAVPKLGAKDTPSSKMFYESPWFWGSLGGAALIGLGIFLATRDYSGDTIHLRMEVPR
jgi:hypothetical protein